MALPASTVATNHLYGYKWCEDDEGGEEQWCRALVVSVTDSQVSEGSTLSAVSVWADAGSAVRQFLS